MFSNLKTTLKSLDHLVRHLPLSQELHRLQLYGLQESCLPAPHALTQPCGKMTPRPRPRACWGASLQAL